jgi:hypothetical protein
MISRVNVALWRSAFQSFLDQPGPWEFIASWAKESRCLPVYCDWTHAFGVTEDGSVFAYEHDPWPQASLTPANERIPLNAKVSDPSWLNVALRHGMKAYPWLEDLLPERPSDAQDCSQCSGTGRIPIAADLVCHCGGSGWVPGGRR